MPRPALKGLTISPPIFVVSVWNQDKKCEFPLCRKVPSYGYEGQRPRLCGEHKGHGMVNVSGTREPKVGHSRE